MYVKFMYGCMYYKSYPMCFILAPASIQRVDGYDGGHDLGQSSDILWIGGRQELPPGERRVRALGADPSAAGHRGGRPSGEMNTPKKKNRNFCILVLLVCIYVYMYVCVYICAFVKFSHS